MSRFSPIRSKTVPEPPPDEIQPENIPHPEAQKKFSAPSAFGVQLTFNEAKNGLQLHFSSKPSDEVRAELKAAGWRWSFRNGCWYHRHTEANEDFAERFVARFHHRDTGTQSETKTSKPETPAAPANIIPLPPKIPVWRLRLTRA